MNNESILAKIPDENSPECLAVIILGKIPFENLLQTSTWEKCMDILKPVLAKTVFKGTTIVNQSFFPDFKRVQLPKKIKWESDIHKKIFEKYKTENRNANDLYSLHLQSFFPSFDVCNKQNIFPDIYFKISSNLNYKQDKRFTIGCLFMVKMSLINNDAKAIDSQIMKLNDLFEGILIIKKVRNYQYKFLSGGYTDTIPFIMPNTILDDSNNYNVEKELSDWEVVLKP